MANDSDSDSDFYDAPKFCSAFLVAFDNLLRKERGEQEAKTKAQEEKAKAQEQQRLRLTLEPRRSARISARQAETCIGARGGEEGRKEVANEKEIGWEFENGVGSGAEEKDNEGVGGEAENVVGPGAEQKVVGGQAENGVAPWAEENGNEGIGDETENGVEPGVEQKGSESVRSETENGVEPGTEQKGSEDVGSEAENEAGAVVTIEDQTAPRDDQVELGKETPKMRERLDNHRSRSTDKWREDAERLGISSSLGHVAEDCYYVEKILDVRVCMDTPTFQNEEDPILEYKVKWEQWPEDFNSWIKEEDFECGDMVEQFWKEKSRRGMERN